MENDPRAPVGSARVLPRIRAPAKHHICRAGISSGGDVLLANVGAYWYRGRIARASRSTAAVAFGLPNKIEVESILDVKNFDHG
jgi:hypothetical protein